MNNRFPLHLVLAIALLAFAKLVSAAEFPTISTVQRKVVFVDVPPGYSSVTLHQRDTRDSRRGKVLAIRETDPEGGKIRFVLKRMIPRRGLSVSGTRLKPEDQLVVDGKVRSFLADPSLVASNGVSAAVGAAPGVVAMTRAATDSVVASGSATTATAREVSESDIWQIAGDRLYFFNQLRGLQVFDIADPDAPVLLGQLREPNRGEQMYLLDADHVALLTRPSYFFAFARNAASPADNQPGSGAVVIADVAAGKPEEVARLSYPGWFVESRIVGSVLYLVSQVNDAEGRYGLVVSSYDLGDPGDPKLSDVLELGSYGSVISATDRYLFVVKSGDDWRRSVVEVVDISAPDGSLVKCGQIQLAGQVPDKFKLNLEGDLLTVVSAVPRNWSGNWNAPENLSRTMVETFTLEHPDDPVKLGSLEIGVGETVHATRFSGDRLYVVTFLTIDPLWVIDLSDPRQPTLLGELEVPGFSTYIEPLGDRLVGIGRVDSRTAVSLFDISDPAKPTLLSQLPLGEGYSYSEANWDEKAFSLFPEHGLILVPYSGYDRSSGWASRIQLIDLGRDSLTKRGIVDQGFAARRTAVLEDRILAVSASDLITVNFADRDLPEVTSDVEIAWRVDRVFLSGDHLLEIGGSADWSRSEPPSITITTAEDPDTTVDLYELENVPVTGATIRDGKLYLAQQDSNVLFPIYKPANGNVTQGTTNPLILSVFDVSALPEITRIGRTEATVDPGYGYGAGQLEPAWPNDDTLVWLREPWSSWWWYDVPVLAAGDVAVSARAVTLAPSGSMALSNANLETKVDSIARPAFVGDASIASSSLAVSRIIAPWYRTSIGQEMVVFDVSDPTAPEYASTVNARIGSTGDWSTPVAIDGKLYLSFMAYESGILSKRISRSYRHFLKTVDFADMKNPVVSDEINIPGRLLSVEPGGETLLTVGCLFDSKGQPRSSRAFHTSRYDGTTVTLVDQLRSETPNDPYAVANRTLFIASGGSEKGKEEMIRAWRVGADGGFESAGRVSAGVYSSLAALNGLLVGFGNGLPEVFDVSDPGNLLSIDGADTRELTNSDLGNSDGGAGLGIWQAQGASGVGRVRLPR